MRRLSFPALWLSLLTLMAPQVFGQGKTEEVVIDFGSQFFTGKTVLDLRKPLQQVAPKLNLDLYSIDKIEVWVQSQDYFGTIHFEVGPEKTAKTYITGEIAPFVAAKVNFFRPIQSSQGPWRLSMQGHFILDRVVVTLTNRRYGLDCDRNNLIARSTIINWFAMDFSRTLAEILPHEKGLIELAGKLETTSANLIALDQNGDECAAYLISAMGVASDFFSLQSKILPFEKRFKNLKFEKEFLRHQEGRELLFLETVVEDFDALRQAVFRMDY